MTDIANVYLPLNTYVNVRAFTNAAFLQQVTIAQESGDKTVLTGSGEHDTPMPDDAFAIQTPGSSNDPAGYLVSVAVDSRQSGSWQPSRVISGMVSVMYYNCALVVSEDFQDADWNDAVVQFSWWSPPANR